MIASLSPFWNPTIGRLPLPTAPLTREVNTHDRFPLHHLQLVQRWLQEHYQVDLVPKTQVWAVVAGEDEVER